VSCIRFEGLEYYATSTMPSSAGARLGRLAHFFRELPRALPRMHRAGAYRLSYRDQWRHFVRCVETGAPVESSLDDGRQALSAVLAAAQSTLVRRPVAPRDAPAELTRR